MEASVPEGRNGDSVEFVHHSFQQSADRQIQYLMLPPVVFLNEYHQNRSLPQRDRELDDAKRRSHSARFSYVATRKSQPPSSHRTLPSQASLQGKLSLSNVKKRQRVKPKASPPPKEAALPHQIKSRADPFSSSSVGQLNLQVELMLDFGTLVPTDLTRPPLSDGWDSPSRKARPSLTLIMSQFIPHFGPSSSYPIIAMP
jgi:hypothetical protein